MRDSTVIDACWQAFGTKEETVGEVTTKWYYYSTLADAIAAAKSGSTTTAGARSLYERSAKALGVDFVVTVVTNICG